MSKLYTIVDLARMLRAKNLAISTTEIIDSVKAMSLFQRIDEETLYNLITCTLIKGRKAWLYEDRTRKSLDINFKGVSSGEARSYQKGVFLISSYSPLESKGEAVIEDADRSEYLAIKRSLKKLSRILATLPGRRMQRRMKGSIDMRGTLRASLTSGTFVTKLKRSERKNTRSRILYLFDVSGSMSSYYDKLFKMIAASSAIRNRVFAFSTELVRLDSILSGVSLEKAKELVLRNVPIWGSGTRIGEAIKTLLNHHREELTSNTILVIVSDGLDRGEPKELTESLQQVKYLTNGLIWLNPLADDDSYRPATEGMLAALPYVDRLMGLEKVLKRPGLICQDINWNK